MILLLHCTILFVGSSILRADGYLDDVTETKELPTRVLHPLGSPLDGKIPTRILHPLGSPLDGLDPKHLEHHCNHRGLHDDGESLDGITQDHLEHHPTGPCDPTPSPPEGCQILFVDCELPQDFERLQTTTIDILCNYVIAPDNGDYISIMYGLEDDGTCQYFNPSNPRPEFLRIVEGTSRGIGKKGYFGVQMNVDRELLSREISFDPINPTFEFCYCLLSEGVVYDLVGTEMRMSPHLTKVCMTLLFNGNFQLDNILLRTGEIDRSEVELQKSYDVRAYVCSTSEPHEEITSPEVYSRMNKVLGVCVVSNSDDTFMERIVDYELFQYTDNDLNREEHMYTYISGGNAEQYVSFYSCENYKPGSDILGSMCYIQVFIAEEFFNKADFDIKAVGIADLRLINNVVTERVGNRDLGGVVTQGSYEVDISLRRENFILENSGSSYLKGISIYVGAVIYISLLLI